MSKDKESRRKCFVCGRSPGKDPLTSLFRFPHPGKKNSLRCELWAKYVFPDKEYWSSEIHQKLYKEHRMLCNRHFKRTSFVDYPFAATKLHRFAVPDDDSVLDWNKNDGANVTKDPIKIESDNPLTSREQHLLFCTEHDHAYKSTMPRLVLNSTLDTDKANEPQIDLINEDVQIDLINENIDDNPDDPDPFEDDSQTVDHLQDPQEQDPQSDLFQEKDPPSDVFKEIVFETVTLPPPSSARFTQDAPVPDPSEKIISSKLPAPTKNKTFERQPIELETEAITEDIALPELDPDIVQDNNPPLAYGDPIDPKLAQAWIPVLKNGLSKVTRDKILDEYITPNNCLLIQASKLNPEIIEEIPDKPKINDNKWAMLQRFIGTALTAVNRAMTTIINSQYNMKDKTDVLKHLNDSCLILCDLHFAHTRIRIKNVTPYLEETTKQVVEGMQHERDQTLFGSKFSVKLRVARNLAKSGRKKKKMGRPRKHPIKKENCGPSLVRYSGTWRAPLGQPKIMGRMKRRLVRRKKTPGAAATTPKAAPKRRDRPPKPRVRRRVIPISGDAVTNLMNECVNENLVLRPVQNFSPANQDVKVETYEVIATDTGQDMPMLEIPIDDDKPIELMQYPEHIQTFNFNPQNSTVIITKGDTPLVLPRPRDMPTLSDIQTVSQDTIQFLADDNVTEVVIDPHAEEINKDMSAFLKFKAKSKMRHY